MKNSLSFILKDFRYPKGIDDDGRGGLVSHVTCDVIFGAETYVVSVIIPMLYVTYSTL